MAASKRSYTRGELREGLLRRIVGYHPQFTVASASVGTLTSSDLTLLAEGGIAASLERWWFLITSGSKVGQFAHIIAHTIDEGIATITFSVAAFGGDALPTGTKCVALYRHPDVLHDAINTACLDLYPDLHVRIVDNNQTISGILKNPSFELLDPENANVFADWTSAPGLVAVSAAALHGNRCASLVSSPNADNLSATLDRGDVISGSGSFRTAGLGGRFGCFVKAADASKVRLRLYDGPTDDDLIIQSAEFEDNTVVNDWEYLYISDPGGVRGVTRVGIRNTGDTVALVDAAFAYDGTYYRYPVPDEFIDFPSVVAVQEDRYFPNGSYLPLTDWQIQEDILNRHIVLGFAPEVTIENGLYLRLEGRKPVGRELIDEDADDSAIVEVNGPQSEVLIEYSAFLVKERFAEATDYEAAKIQMMEADHHKRRAMELLKRGIVRKSVTTSPGIPEKLVT